MTFAIKVNGGTGAGCKRPLRDKPAAWTHPCTLGVVRELSGHWTRCPDCGTQRDRQG